MIADLMGTLCIQQAVVCHLQRTGEPTCQQQKHKLTDFAKDEQEFDVAWLN